jgi:hypothetical protein
VHHNGGRDKNASTHLGTLLATNSHRSSRKQSSSHAAPRSKRACTRTRSDEYTIDRHMHALPSRIAPRTCPQAPRRPDSWKHEHDTRILTLTTCLHTFDIFRTIEIVQYSFQGVFKLHHNRPRLVNTASVDNKGKESENEHEGDGDMNNGADVLIHVVVGHNCCD